jgi:isopenicillin-N N-acyltransferase-like protein
MEAKPSVIRVSGSSYDIGYQHGQQCKEKINDSIHNFLEYMKVGANLSKTMLLDLSARYVPYTKEYAPDLMEEVQGIADGAELTFEDIFLWNCLSSDFLEILDPQLGDNFSLACTSLAISSNLKTKDDLFVAQNLDWLSTVQENVILLKNEQTNGVRSLVFTVAGRLGFAGLNDYGVALCVNKLFSLKNRVGVPNQFIYRKVLQQKTIGDALGAILYGRRTAGMNYVLMDESGEILDIETTATKYEIIYGFKGYIAHSNHFMTAKLKSFERLPLPVVDSIVRLNRVNRLLSEPEGTITLDKVKEIFQDHVNYPNSMCRHGDERIPETLRMKTLVSIIMNPKVRKVWFTLGNPCENPYLEEAIYHC